MKKLSPDVRFVLSISPVGWLHLAQLFALVGVAYFASHGQTGTALVIAILVLIMQGLIVEVKND